MKKQSLSALAAAGLLAGGLSVTSASAADLGGNCCADLEERIAELEATTARKGNRKVSLTISGWVAEQITWWDNEDESNVYVGGIGRTLQSNVKFTGQATIVPGWTAGYVLHVEFGTEDSFTQGPNNDDTPLFAGSLPPGSVNDTEKGVYTLQSYWFVKSESLGKVSIGKQSQASDNAAILVDGSGSLVPANWVMFDGLQMSASSNLLACKTINDNIGGDCNGITLNAVRYDTPTFGGFSASASWGEDDFWDVALRYAGEGFGFKFAAAAAYTENKDERTGVVLSAVTLGAVNEQKDVSYFQAGVYLQHVATGLFAYGAYGHEQTDSLYNGVDIGMPDSDVWYVKAGIRQRWTPLGHTVLYGEYANHQDQLSVAYRLAGASSSDVDRYGIGIVQEIDNAAMSVWLAYRHHEGDYSCDAAGAVCAGGLPSVDINDVDIVKFGGLINF